MRGWLSVDGDAVTNGRSLNAWIDRGIEFARGVPPKAAKKQRRQLDSSRAFRFARSLVLARRIARRMNVEASVRPVGRVRGISRVRGDRFDRPVDDGLGGDVDAHDPRAIASGSRSPTK
jgi:hypothetical protein